MHVFKKYILPFYREYNEWFTLPISLSLFFLSPYLYWMIDETAGAYDIGGVIHPIITSTLMLHWFCASSWFLIKVMFPDLKKYLDDYAEDAMINGTPDQYYKVVMAFGVFLIFISFHILIVYQL